MIRDFSGKDLRDQSFSGLILRNADFSNSDISGVDFSEADLEGANFTEAEIGINNMMLIKLILLIVPFIFSLFGGFLCGLYAALQIKLVRFLLNNVLTDGYIISTISVFFSIFACLYLFVSVRKGTLTGLISLLGAIALPGSGSGAMAISCAISISNFAGGIIIFFSTTLVSFYCSIFFESYLAALSALIFSAFSVWLYWNASILQRHQLSWLRSPSLNLGAIGGACFDNANLKGVDFSFARFTGTHLKNSCLDRTCFYGSKGLDTALLDGTIIKAKYIRNLLVKGQSQYSDFSDKDLHGAFLNGANLSRINLSGTDLTGATLEGAALEQANLSKAQLVSANLKNVSLTGSCIDAWNIDKNTDLENIQCEHIYLKIDSNGKFDDRVPALASRKFETDEFSQLFYKVSHTLDILINEKYELEALFHTLDKLHENGENLTIQAIEKKLSGAKFSLAFSEKSDTKTVRLKLEQEFEEQKELMCSLIERNAQMKLDEHELKDKFFDEIGLRNLVSLQQKTSPFNVFYNKCQILGDTGMSAHKNTQTISDSTVTNSTLNLGKISGSLNKAIRELSDDKKDISVLLKNIQELLEGSELSTTAKADAVDKLLELANSLENPEEDKKTAFDKIIGYFYGLSSVLQAGAKLKDLLLQLAEKTGSSM